MAAAGTSTGLTGTDCQDTRDEVVIAESMSPVGLNEIGCKVLKERWFDPDTRLTVQDLSRLDGDDLVPLAAPHRSEAEPWHADRRRAFAKNLTQADGLIAVTSVAIRSNGDCDPVIGLPSDESYRCKCARS